MLRTLHRGHGLIVLHIAPGCEAEVDGILTGLTQTMRIEACRPLQDDTGI